MSRRTLILLPAALLCLPASGADLLQCVNPDVRQGLLFIVPGDPEPDITDEMPAQIAAIPRPEGLTWIAASLRSSGVVGAFRTDDEPQVAVDAAIAALIPEGWIPDGSFASSRSPFASPAIDVSQTLCRDGDLRSVSARQSDGVTYLTYNVPRNAERTVCQTGPGPGGSPFGRPSGGPFGGPAPGATGVAALVPALEFTTLDPTAIPRNGGGGGVGGSFSRTTTIRIGAELGAVAGHVEAQLDAQGWERDAEWSGSATAGSTWTRSMEGGQLAALAVDVLDRGSSSYEIAIRLTELRQGGIER